MYVLNQFFRHKFFDQISEESIATSVLSAIVSLATMEELAEHREAITLGIQPLFAEAMAGVIEEFQTMMAKTLPSEEEIKQVTEQLTEQVAPGTQTNQTLNHCRTLCSRKQGTIDGHCITT